MELINLLLQHDTHTILRNSSKLVIRWIIGACNFHSWNSLKGKEMLAIAQNDWTWYIGIELYIGPEPVLKFRWRVCQIPVSLPSLIWVGWR